MGDLYAEGYESTLPLTPEYAGGPKAIGPLDPSLGAFFVVIFEPGTPFERRISFRQVGGITDEITTDTLSFIHQPALAAPSVTGRKFGQVSMLRGVDHYGYLRQWWSETQLYHQGRGVMNLRRDVNIYTRLGPRFGRNRARRVKLINAGVAAFRVGRLDAQASDVFVEEVKLVCEDIRLDIRRWPDVTGSG